MSDADVTPLDYAHELGLTSLPSAHDCNYNWFSERNDDGTLHQVCYVCGKDFGQVLLSGTEWFSCVEVRTILPRRPVFHDAEREREWFREYVAQERAAGAWLSPEVLAKVA